MFIYKKNWSMADSPSENNGLDRIFKFRNASERENLIDSILPELVNISKLCIHAINDECDHFKAIQSGIQLIFKHIPDIYHYSICERIARSVFEKHDTQITSGNRHGLFFRCIAKTPAFCYLAGLYPDWIFIRHEDVVLEQFRRDDPVFNASVLISIMRECSEEYINKFIRRLPIDIFMALSCHCAKSNLVRAYYSELMDKLPNTMFVSVDKGAACVNPIQRIYTINLHTTDILIGYTPGKYINIVLTKKVDSREHTTEFSIAPFSLPAVMPHDRTEYYNKVTSRDTKNHSFFLSARNTHTDFAICSVRVFDVTCVFSIPSGFKF